MILRKFNIFIVPFLSLLFSLAAPWEGAQAQTSSDHEGRVKVVTDSAMVRQRPDTKARALGKLGRGRTLRVAGQTPGWVKVELRFKDGSKRYGWVVQGTVQRLKAPSRVITPRKIQRKEEKKVERKAERMGDPPRGGQTVRPRSGRFTTSSSSHSRERAPGVFSHGLRVFMAPVFNLYQFGSFQFRVGAGYEFPVSRRIRLGIPISFSTGGGFHSLQAGADITYDLAVWGMFELSSRTGLYFERFAGNGRSFLAGTIDVALPIRVRFARGWVFGLELVSMELMPLATQNIPFNIRGQVMAEVRGEW